MATKDISDLQVCQAVHHSMLNGGGTVTPLMLLTEQHYKVCWRALERAIARRFIDYGVSINGAFLCEKGWELLFPDPQERKQKQDQYYSDSGWIIGG